MISSFVYLATSGDMNTFCEVVVYRTALRNGRIGYVLDVRAHQGFPERPYERLARNTRTVEAEDCPGLVATAEGLVKSVESDYGIAFDRGDRAMERRQWVFAVCPETRAALAAKGWK